VEGFSSPPPPLLLLHHSSLQRYSGHSNNIKSIMRRNPCPPPPPPPCPTITTIQFCVVPPGDESSNNDDDDDDDSIVTRIVNGEESSLLKRSSIAMSTTTTTTASSKESNQNNNNNNGSSNNNNTSNEPLQQRAQAQQQAQQAQQQTQELPLIIAATLPLLRHKPKRAATTTTTTSSKKNKNIRMQLFSFLNRPQVEVLSLAAVLLSVFLVALDTLQELPMDLSKDWIPPILDMINVVLAFDFFLRWYAAGNFKALYLTKPLVVLDIVVILIPLFLGNLILPLVLELKPLMMMTTTLTDNNNNNNNDAALVNILQSSASAWQFDSSGLQNLLLLRIFRLRRVLTDINTFVRFQQALGVKLRLNDVRPYQLQLARVLLSIFTLLSVASGLIYTTEHETNPNIPDYFAALYFGLTTLTTVGFGE
jgi:Ion transport protein